MRHYFPFEMREWVKSMGMNDSVSKLSKPERVGLHNIFWKKLEATTFVSFLKEFAVESEISETKLINI